MTKYSRVILAAGVFIIVVMVGFAIAIQRYMREPKLGGDFKLTHGQKTWVFSENAKPLNLLYFGYVKCPDVCPMSLSRTSEAFKRLSESERADIQVLFINVDVKNETPESVATYASQFNPNFIGLTGEQLTVDDVVDAFGASYMVDKDPKSYLGYSVLHTDRLFVLNDRGIVIDSVQSPRSADVILAKIKEHL